MSAPAALGPASDGCRVTARRWATTVSWMLVVLYLVVFGSTLWMDARIYATHAPQTGWFWLALHGPWLGPFAVFAVVGAVIASRRPRHTIGWLLLASALGATVGEALRTYAKLLLGASAEPSAATALALQTPGVMITVLGILLGVALIPLLFPDGRLPSRRWRGVEWGIGVALVLLLVEGLFRPRVTDMIPMMDGPHVVYDVANPLAVGVPARLAAALPQSDLAIAALVVAAAAAVMVRFRRSRGAEHQQMKWFVFAAALVAAAVAGIAASEIVGAGFTTFGVVGPGLLVAGLCAYPAAIGVAVLRYRLYEIDRLVSRTVSYALVVAVLVGVYITGVIGLGAAVTALTGQGDSDPVIAVSTLAVAGLFRPVRARIQSGVDRRFNRTGYEAQRAVEAFARDVRDEVDLEQIRRRVVETAAVATQPAHVSVGLMHDGKAE